MENTKNKLEMVFYHLITFFMLGAGIVHILIIPEHFSHAPAHGLMFLLLGITEIFWSILFYKRPSNTLYKIGIVLAGISIFLWVITRIFPAPFGHGPEGIDFDDIIVKLLEGFGVVGLILLSVFISEKRKKIAWRDIAMLLIIAILSSVFIYSLAKTVEPIFPFLRGEEQYYKDDNPPTTVRRNVLNMKNIYITTHTNMFTEEIYEKS